MKQFVLCWDRQLLSMFKSWHHRVFFIRLGLDIYVSSTYTFISITTKQRYCITLCWRKHFIFKAIYYSLGLAMIRSKNCLVSNPFSQEAGKEHHTDNIWSISLIWKRNVFKNSLKCLSSLTSRGQCHQVNDWTVPISIYF